MTVLEVKNLQKIYRRGPHEITVLSDFHLQISAGESLAVVGASGVGKSTLLHCLGLLDRIDRGAIIFDGIETQNQTPEQLAKIRREKMGFVFQFHYLMAELSALENVMVPLLIQKKSKENAQNEARLWLDRVGLSHRLEHRPAELSGGEQQRVAIARALVVRPKLILADEPTGNLDPETAKEVFSILAEQCSQLNSVLIMATHNLDLADRLKRKGVLKKGRLEC